MILATIVLILLGLSGGLVVLVLWRRSEDKKAAQLVKEDGERARRLQAAMHDPRPYSSPAAKGFHRKQAS